MRIIIITNVISIIPKNKTDYPKIGGGNSVFCNPPYGRESTARWIKKCAEEARKPNTTVVMLIPSRTDTKAFHEYIYGKAEIRFVKGRLKFGGSKYGAPFPSMIVIFRGEQ